MVGAVRALLVTVAAVAASAVAPAATGAASTATTYSCQQVWSGFNIQLIGDREWGWNLDALATLGVPKKKTVIAVWSLGAKVPGGMNAYSWSTEARTRPSPKCKPLKAQLKAPSLSGLSPMVRTKDGWSFGRKFACFEQGPILITTTPAGGTTRVVVRLQRSGRVMAVAEVGNGGGWIRGSTRCQSKEK
jgi:hypothetical protein